MATARVSEKLSEAISAGSRRDYPKAVRLLEEILSRGEAPPEALLYLGRSYHALADYPRALAAFRDYIREHPKSAQARFFAGRTYLAMGQNQRAIPLLKDALSKRPNDGMIMSLLGMAWLKSHKSGKAVDILQKAVEAAPNDRRIYRAYLNALLVRGLKLARVGEDELAIQMLGFVVENGLDAPLPRLELGRLYREAGELPTAREHYERAAAFSPDDPKIRWYLASICLQLGDDAGTARELEALRSLGGDIPEVKWNQELIQRFMIRSLVEAANWREAAKACKDWVREKQDDPAVHALLAEALRNLGDLEGAILHARTAMLLAPTEEGLHYALILILWEKQDWDGLEAEINTVEAMGSTDPILLRFKALLASQKSRDHKKVISLVQDAIRATGPAPELLYALSERYLQLGILDLAESWYHKTREVDPRHERAFLGEIAAVEALYKQRSKGAAARLEAVYKAYNERWSDNIAIRREYALFLVREKHYQAASDELQVLLGWEPANLTLRKLLAWSFMKCKRYREAAVLLKGLLRENPRDLNLLMELCHSLEKAGAGLYSQKILSQALPLFPKDPEPAMALGTLSLRQGKTEMAIDAFREAASRAPNDPRPCLRLAELYRKSGVEELAARYEHEASLRQGTKERKKK